MKTRCSECEAREMEPACENYKYTESGLDYVTLVNVQVRKCKTCGAREVVIPRIEELHRVLARTVATKATRLVGLEIKFLRKYLGHSGKDFAPILGTTPETLSRWERDHVQISTTFERYLRLMVFNEEPAESYPREQLAKSTPRKAAKFRINARDKNSGWAAESAR